MKRPAKARTKESGLCATDHGRHSVKEGFVTMPEEWLHSSAKVIALRIKEC
ncbi:MAG: hypothetical protein H7329_12390 [Opitutaceae bacterium]|nr:hypothetical protein [Cytophagales bacterium]